jgi:hypothetical protein
MENKRRHGRSEFCGNMSNWGRLECKMYRVWCGKINRKFGLDPKDKQFSSSSYHKESWIHLLIQGSSRSLPPFRDYS